MMFILSWWQSVWQRGYMRRLVFSLLRCANVSRESTPPVDWLCFCLWVWIDCVSVLYFEMFKGASFSASPMSLLHHHPLPSDSQLCSLLVWVKFRISAWLWEITFLQASFRTQRTHFCCFSIISSVFILVPHTVPCFCSSKCNKSGSCLGF